MSAERGWLLLIHQIPPTPAYLRVKVGRQLQRLGAIAIKSSVYALPKSDGAHEQLEWLLREIVKGGGDGSICEARFVEGLSDTEVRAMFTTARSADYDAIAEEIRTLQAGYPKRKKLDEASSKKLAADAARMKRRLEDVAEIDFFGSPRRGPAEAALADLVARTTPIQAPIEGATLERTAYRGRTWVTRKGIHVDRMASAWLIRRFIDPAAKLRFGDKGAEPKAGELRFDMFGGEFTHEGDLCTFEVLCAKFGLDDAGVKAIGEVVHDIDLRDGKFDRPETPGIALIVAAIAGAHREDDRRLERASSLWDDLYEHYRNRKREGGT